MVRYLIKLYYPIYLFYPRTNVIGVYYGSVVVTPRVQIILLESDNLKYLEWIAGKQDGLSLIIGRAIQPPPPPNSKKCTFLYIGAYSTYEIREFGMREYGIRGKHASSICICSEYARENNVARIIKCKLRSDLLRDLLRNIYTVCT